MHANPLICKVKQSLSRLDIPDGDGFVVAVSGGPDSVALLRALLEVRGAGEGKVVAAHLNHQLRGGESDADEAFVAELVGSLRGSCAALDVCSERLDVRAVAAECGANLEETARRLRYDWLARVAAERDICWLATGHTADDQAETVLHRLLRGTGIKGLRAIAGRRELRPGVSVVRPLLDVTRQEVLAYLQSVDQPFCSDSSNLDPHFTRNRLRHELLPLLAEQYNPRIGDVLCRLAGQADELYSAIEVAARRLLEEAERPRAGACVILDRDALKIAHAYLVCEVFRLVWDREGWPQRAMGHDDWQRLADLVQGKQATLDLPGGLRARLRERVVQLGPVP